jgi:SAM-dependent methyltransferase
MNTYLNYKFEEVLHCEMCGDDTKSHKVLGQRLNKSQGLKPKSRTGISVTVKQCKKCDLIYASPMPIPHSIQDHYGIPPEEYWKPSYFEWESGYFAREISTLKKLSRFENGAKALDIGAGIGKAMISLSKAGFDVYGFEPSEPFHERAISKMGISRERLKLGMIEEVDYENEFFDFITFGAVLEHLYHPAQSIEKAMQWLKPGGIIQIEVPSSKHLIPKLVNLYYRLIGTNYVTNISPMHEPFHLYEYGLKSFQELAKKLNYDIILHQYYVCRIYHVPKVFHPVLRNYMERTGTGMQLAVWLKKK